MLYTFKPGITVLGKVIIKPEKSFSFLSYLIQGESNVLIDTVPERAAEEYLRDLESCISLDNLDALILNHSEEDHSGALSALLNRRPDLPIYCTPACEKRISAVHPTACLTPVDTGSFLRIGNLRFHFVHTPGLHWDDNMTTYLENEHILFSNDLFGQSLGAEIPLDSKFTADEILSGARSYFEKVFSAASPEEKSAVFGLASPELCCIAPGHGLILQDHLEDVLGYYEEVCR